MASSNRILWISGSVFILALVVYVVMTSWPNGTSKPASTTSTKVPGSVVIPTTLAAGFGTYVETPVKVTPVLAPYKITSNLSNIINLNRPVFNNLTATDKTMLAKNGFVVNGTQFGEDEFFPPYEKNRYALIPNFITTDSLLHNVHLYFDYLLKSVEEQHLIATAQQLSQDMLAASDKQYSQLKGTAYENAAKRNVAFFAVASKIIDPQTVVPSYVTVAVETDLGRINSPDKQSEPVPSAVMALGESNPAREDFTQYIPRGHYDRSDALKNYFKAMMWYGRLTFRLKEPDEIRSAVLMTKALREGTNEKLWSAIYEPTQFFVGKSDDLTFPDFRDLVDTSFGPKVTLAALAADSSGFASFQQAAAKLAPPQVNSIPIAGTSLEPDSNRTDDTKGFRFMGQRFTLDASIFQHLICREVGNTDGTMKCPVLGGTAKSRMLPKALDVPAAMGSAEAASILKEAGDFQYKQYPENMKAMQTYIAGLTTATWTQNLYWSWLYALRPLTETKPAGYPTFMTNQAWARKDLTTYLGSWTELKHDTILYAKQSYAELGGGGDETPPDDRGYVEPEPFVFARISSLARFIREGLDLRGLISPANKDDLKKLENLAAMLKDVSVKELNNQQLAAADYELIRSYGGQLEHFWLAVNKDTYDPQKETQADYLNDNPAALVADVATDPNGAVLEEGTGRIRPMYVVVQIDGKLHLTIGYVYSHYEFMQPINQRLTDTAWHAMLNHTNTAGQADQVPPVADWTKSFLSLK